MEVTELVVNCINECRSVCTPPINKPMISLGIGSLLSLPGGKGVWKLISACSEASLYLPKKMRKDGDEEHKPNFKRIIIKAADGLSDITVAAVIYEVAYMLMESRGEDVKQECFDKYT